MAGVYKGPERRKFGRRETFSRATVIINGHKQPFRCTIRNISEGGAYLVFDDPIIPKGRFRVSFLDNRFEILCEVMHSDQQGAGVQFLDAQAGRALMRHFQFRPVNQPADARLEMHLAPESR